MAAPARSRRASTRCVREARSTSAFPSPVASSFSNQLLTLVCRRASRSIGYLAGGSAPDISRLILLKGALLRGILIGSRKHLEELSDFVETAKLKPLVDKVFEFDQAKEAYQFLSEATLVGKVVIRVA